MAECEGEQTNREAWQKPRLIVVGADEARNNDSGAPDGTNVS